MNKIRLLRKQKKISQLDLARSMHVTQTAVSHWETGKNLPDMAQAIQLANFFGVSTDYLLGRTDTIKESSPTISTEEALAIAFKDMLGRAPTAGEAKRFLEMGKLFFDV